MSVATTAVSLFVEEVRAAFETETTIDRILQRTKESLERLLVRPDCLDGQPIDRSTVGSWKLYTDPDHLFCIHASHQRPHHRRPPHDHGELGWAVYGVVEGEVFQQPYERLDHGSDPTRATLRPLPLIRQQPGQATIIPVSVPHATGNDTETGAWTIVIRSRDQATVWRCRYDPDAGTVKRFRGGAD
jgi:predicted metal-dependent enzyme (double-stranded beta helix superfamily)